MCNQGKTTQLICIHHMVVGEWYFEVEKRFQHLFYINQEEYNDKDMNFINTIERYNDLHNEEICVASITFTDGSLGLYHVKPKIKMNRNFFPSTYIVLSMTEIPNLNY